MDRVEIAQQENNELTEFLYEFKYFEDGKWSADWLAGGLPAPDKYATIVGVIDLDDWEKDITGEYGGSSSMYVKYLGMTPADAAAYITKLKKAGFQPVKDWDGKDTDELSHSLRIDGKLYQVRVEQQKNNELTEFLYKFKFDDGK
jgi:hypothetical protein